jgi:hypothetical protein
MNETVAIIPCTNQKSNVAGPAREVWQGAHFQLTLAHAELFYDRVLVMSYKYGFISPDEIIEPYDIDIRYSSAGDRLKWWWKIREDIKKLGTEEPKLVALYTGYDTQRVIREFVRNEMYNVIQPWEGSRVGERMQLVYDGVPPFDPAKLEAGDYALPPSAGELPKRGRPPKGETEEVAMEWEAEEE